MQTIPTLRIRELLAEILELCLTTPTARADIFFNLSPHCDVVTVDYHAGGWQSGASADWTDNFSLRRESTVADLEKLLHRLRASLEGMSAEELAAHVVARKFETTLRAFTPQSIAA